MPFNVGDRVETSFGTKGVVRFGPFKSVAGKETHYLVERLDGAHFSAAERVLARLPKFQAGQKVTFSYSPEGEEYELIAGPFPGDEGAPLWVLRDKDGVHDTSWEKHMVPVVE